MVALVSCHDVARDHLPSAEHDAGALETLQATDRDRVRALAVLENERRDGEITGADLIDHDPGVRRAAVRALARTAHPRALPRLLQSLADEDAEVVAWCAHGLGDLCRAPGQPAAETIRALITRAATLASEPASSAGLLDPWFALVRAIGRCGGEDAESALRTWLAAPRARAAAAALGLADLAARQKTLGADTEAALLSAASGDASHPPVSEALAAFEHLEAPSRAFVQRLRPIAEARLQSADAGRLYAIRALAHSDPGAAGVLRHILLAPEQFTASERSEAARALGQLGEAGQRALAEALNRVALLDDDEARAALRRDHGPLLVHLEQLHEADAVSKRSLFELAHALVPRDSLPFLARRIIQLRCRAAALLVNAGFDEPLLTTCDPDSAGETGQLAQLSVLARRPLRALRLAQYRKLADSPHLRVRETALRMLQDHPEAFDPVALTSALDSSDPVLITRAAEFLSAHPERVPAAQSESLAQTLLKGLDKPGEIARRGALMQAAAALQIGAAIPAIERACAEPNPALRAHAARALALLHAQKAACDRDAPYEPASELDHLVTSPLKLLVESESATLEISLDPALAPVAVTRLKDLAASGFYDGLLVHRVVPGFVVQFGDPQTGVQSGRSEPLRCETSPRPFEAFDVGMALSGKDTATSQIFVALSRQPHLDGNYTIVGHATGDWNALAASDAILRVKVLP